MRNRFLDWAALAMVVAAVAVLVLGFASLVLGLPTTRIDDVSGCGGLCAGWSPPP